MVQTKKDGDAGTEPAERREQILASAGELFAAKHPYACHIYQHDFNYLRTLPRYAVLDEMARDGERAWLDLLSEGAAQGQFRTDIEPIVFYRFSRDAIFLSVRWYRPGGHRTI